MLWGYYKVCSLTKWVVILKLWDDLVVVERIKILSLHLCDWLILGRLVSLSAVKWWYRFQVYRIVVKINDDDEDNTNYYLWNTLLAPYIVLLNFIGLLMNERDNVTRRCLLSRIVRGLWFTVQVSLSQLYGWWQKTRDLWVRAGFQYSQHWCTQSINIFLSVPQAPLLPPEQSEEGQIIAAQCALLHSIGTLRRF